MDPGAKLLSIIAALNGLSYQLITPSIALINLCSPPAPSVSMSHGESQFTVNSRRWKLLERPNHSYCSSLSNRDCWFNCVHSAPECDHFTCPIRWADSDDSLFRNRLRSCIGTHRNTFRATLSRLRWDSHRAQMRTLFFNVWIELPWVKNELLIGVRTEWLLFHSFILIKTWANHRSLQNRHPSEESLGSFLKFYTFLTFHKLQ